MALKTYPNVPVYMPVITVSHKVTSAEGTANAVDIAFDRPVTAVIAQIQAPTTGLVYATALAAVITTVTTEGSESCKVTITGTDIVTDMIVNVIAW